MKIQAHKNLERVLIINKFTDKVKILIINIGIRISWM